MVSLKHLLRAKREFSDISAARGSDEKICRRQKGQVRGNSASIQSA
jgi:hypothetical protein